MGLTVSNATNNHVYKNQNTSSNRANPRHVQFMLANSYAKNDKSNDGKFSLSEALKNFGQGLVSPITSMFSSGKSFLIGASTILATSALVVATGGAAAPLLVVGGVAMGAFQGAKAIGKIAGAKNGDDVEKAFFDVGGATGTLGLSLMGAKASLKQSGTATNELNSFSAVAKCFKDVKRFASESANAFTNGYFKTNLYNAVKPYIYTSRIRKLSNKFFMEGKESFSKDFQEVKSILPDEFKDKLKGRPKCKCSIIDKLIDRGVYNDKIRKIKNNSQLTAEQKAEEINKLTEMKKKFKTDEIYAKNLVDDLVGTRLVVEDPVPENINKIVDSLTKAIKDDKIVVTEIKNYRGPESENGFYFNKEQIIKLKEATESKGRTLKTLSDSKTIKDSGYCAVQIKIKHKSGSWGELQIRGSHVDDVANWEHITYDLRKGKDLTKGSSELGKLLYPLKKAINNLSESQYSSYEKYISKLYKHARDQELGIIYEEPKLPEGFDEILSAKNLRKLFEDTKAITPQDRNHFNMSPELAFADGSIPNNEG